MTNSPMKKRDWQELSNLHLTAEQEYFFSQTVIDSIHGSFYMLDADGKLVRWNAFLRDEISGKPEQQMAGTNVLDFFHPDDRLLITEKIKKILTQGSEEHVEVRALIHGGPEVCWRLITGRRITIQGVPFVIGLGMDISQRKKAELALSRSEDRFKKLFEHHAAIKVLIDPETGNIIDANHSAADFYGWSIEELKRMNIQQINIIPSEIISNNFEKIRSTRQNRFIFSHHRSDGSVRDVEVFSNKIDVEGKEILYAIIHDITERKRYESFITFRIRLLELAETNSVKQLLKLTIEEVERMTDSSIGFFHLVDEDQNTISMQTWSTGPITAIHKTTRRGARFQPKEKEIWTESLRDQRAIIYHDGGEFICKGVTQPTDTKITQALIVPVIRRNRVLAVIGVGNKAGNYDQDDIKIVESLVDIAWDIVARKRSELTEQNTREALIQSQKMELIGQLAGGIAHDFNNMLGVIIGNVEMAMEGQAIHEPLIQNFKNILKATERSADLTRQLLAFARKQPLMPIVLNLNTMIERMLTMLRVLIGENISMIWLPDSHNTMIKVDPSQVDQILVNLCINSRDAIAGNGEITIKTAIISVDKVECSTLSPCKVPGEYVTLSVADNGCGIEKEHLLHIFEPFYTTKTEGNGTGLGLSTVYGLVKQNNGYIDFKSEPNIGTTFTIYLPRHRGYTDNDDSEQDDPSIPYGKETILLVEDEPDILHLSQRMLEEKGYMVLSTTSPREAIRLADKHDGGIDLLLTDVVMPEMNGSELSNTLQATIPHLKTIFMSGYTTDVFLPYSELYERINFIQKPFSFKSLLRTVHNILNKDDV